MTLDHKKPDEPPTSRIESQLVERIVFLAHDFSALEISQMRGMPDLQTLYSAIASDPAFKDQFLKANTQYYQNQRAAVADLLKRSQQTDPSRVLVELRKLKSKPMQFTEQNSGEYDLTLLSAAELHELHRILSNAVPKLSDNETFRRSN